MDPQPNENFFELKVSQEGSAQMIRLYKIVKWVFVGTIIMSLAFLAMAYFRFVMFKMYEKNESDYLIRLEENFYPYYSVLWNILWIVQVYCYFHFTRSCKRAINLQNAEMFNNSFKWLVRSAVLFVIILIIEFIVTLFEMYIQLHLLENYRAQPEF